MKTAITLIALTLPLLMIADANATERKQLADAPVVAGLFEKMSRLPIEEDYAVAAFEVKERFFVESLEGCKQVGPAATLSVVLDVMNQVLMDGGNEDGAMEDLYSEEIDAITEFLGKSRYWICEQSKQLNRGMVNLTSLIAMDGSVRLQFAIAFED